MNKAPPVIQPSINRESLNRMGQAVNWVTMLMIIARAALLVLPLVFILGADNWIVFIWFMFYIIIFGINLLFYLVVFCVAIGKQEDRNKVFGDNIVSWNPLRRFYGAFFVSLIDWATNLTLWVIWLNRNPAYVNSPDHSNTPNVNAAGYYPFQMLCGSFVFSSVVYFIFAFQLVSSLWSQRQALTVRAEKAQKLSDKSALGQYSTRSKELVNVDLRKGANKVTLTKGVVKAFVAFGVLYTITILVFLFIYFYHLFHGQTSMTYVVVTVFLYVSLFFFLMQLFVYYVGWWGVDSVQRLVLTSDADNDSVTAETNAELNSEMNSYFIFGFFVYFFNIIFAIYAYSLNGPNDVNWSTVPQFNSLAIVQAPFFYVWVTTAALNTGAVCFFFYQLVTFAFIGGWNMYEEEEEDLKIAQNIENEPVVNYRASYLVIGLVALLFAIWIVFYSFVIEAMIGGHWFAEHIFPITVSFAIIFFLAIVAVAFYTYQRVSVLDEWVSYNNMERIWRINRDWHLATYRNVVAIFVTFVLQVIILSVTVSNYFEPKRSGPWQCILPITSSAVPPYSSCNVYWAGAILALQCTLWVYLICIIQAFATLTIKVQLSRQVTRAMKN